MGSTEKLSYTTLSSMLLNVFDVVVIIHSFAPLEELHTRLPDNDNLYALFAVSYQESWQNKKASICGTSAPASLSQLAGNMVAATISTFQRWIKNKIEFFQKSQLVFTLSLLHLSGKMCRFR